MPFLDVLRGDSLQGPTTQPAPNSSCLRDLQLRWAMGIRRAFSGRQSDDLDAAASVVLLLIRANAEECAQSRVQKTWEHRGKERERDDCALPESLRTRRHLELHQVHTLLSRRERESKAWTDLLAAISARDFPEIVMLGSPLLEPPSSPSKE